METLSLIHNTKESGLELNMVMNGFDLDSDGRERFYTVNGMHCHMNHPIKVKGSTSPYLS